MKHESNVWVVVLAGGEGRRLSALTVDSDGVSVPKQYCSFGRGRSMLQWALDRARRLAPVERILTVVAREHEAWWESELRGIPRRNVVVQPKNRGTAAGILLPLTEIVRRDPTATVILLPSDHYVADELSLEEAVELAAVAVQERLDPVVLIGITPESAETEYGWILPTRQRAGDTTHPVERFVEKPSSNVARELLEQGAVWNSFVLAASVGTLLRLYRETLPQVLTPFLKGADAPSAAVDELYRDLPTADFSRDLLQRVASRLELVVAPACGWSDLGTPARLRRFLDTSRTPVGAARANVCTA